MDRVLVAEPAELLCLHAVGMILFFFHRVVVPLLAIHARERNPCPHDNPSFISLNIKKRLPLLIFIVRDSITHRKMDVKNIFECYNEFESAWRK